MSRRKKKTSCGDYGGVTTAGKPCTRAPGWGTDHRGKGRCKRHGTRALEQLKADKKKFLKEFAKQPISLTDAATKIGKDQSTIWRWRSIDKDFDDLVQEILRDVDSIRLQLVEDAFFARLARGEGRTGDYVFFMCNRSHGRWKSVNRLGADGGADTAAETARKIHEALGEIQELEEDQKPEEVDPAKATG